MFRTLIAAYLFAGIWCDVSSAQMPPLTVPVEIQFLNRGKSPIEGQFHIRAGQVYVKDAAGKETPSKVGPLSGPKATTFTGAAETILGAPAVVLTTQEVAIPTALENASATLRAAVIPNTTIFVQETRTLAPTNQVTTEFSVIQLVDHKLTILGRFFFHENTYNQSLTEVWPISDAVLAIVTKSSRHPKLNTLFMFDMSRRQLVGMKEFSLLQYLPSTDSVWMAQSVANCDNIEEVFAEAKSKAQTFRLFVKGGIAPDFQTLDEIDGDVARPTESGSSAALRKPKKAPGL